MKLNKKQKQQLDDKDYIVISKKLTKNQKEKGMTPKLDIFIKIPREFK